MDGVGYHSDELKSFHRILGAAISEAKIRGLENPVAEMTRRLFAALDDGERDPKKLKAIVLAGTPAER
ncbi:hypothetical protein DLM45_09800 [Hyphomicrobium methylovorum]|uniref:hypothetical protein n=1 Tax=Hyphomicrobium methylovorum TaxID=84 RepID=UPI0015E68AF1|nr:hypothetical protein [Hyphomicrobium methylovorum]MBA2126512.1 hypothetical protein [Hyphomicrobium methylovorum]